MNQPVPTTSPVEIAAETWLIPNIYAAGPDTYVPVSSMLIRGEQPIIVDTGAPVHQAHWLEMVFSLVEPEDVRWVFLSHDDGDHRGGLQEVLRRCPNATLITNFFSVERISLEEELPLDRMIWLEPGTTFDAGDRRLRLVLPPIFDGPTTRALFDERTEVLWTVDSFAAMTTGAVHHVQDVPRDLYDETFALFNSMVSPWHQFLDPVRYSAHVDSIQALGATAVASAHGPILTGDSIGEAFDRVRAMAGQPILSPPGPAVLEQMVSALVAV